MESMLQTPVELLPALLALLETESVTRAAERMGVGQPAMSRTLERLREATSDDLLVRTGRKLVRTRRAAELLPEVRRALVAAHAVFERPQRFEPASARGVVTLAMGDDMQAALAAGLLQRIRAAAPMLDVRVRPLGLESALDAVRGTLDVAVLPDLRREMTIPSLDELVLTRQYTRRFVTVTRAKRRLTLARFAAAEHVLVAPRGGEGGYVDDALRALGLTRRVAVTVPGFLAALTLLKQTDLVATLPEEIVCALAPELQRMACPVETPALEMCVGWAARFQSDDRHRWLRTLVGQAVRALGARKGVTKR